MGTYLGKSNYSASRKYRNSTCYFCKLFISLKFLQKKFWKCPAMGWITKDCIGGRFWLEAWIELCLSSAQRQLQLGELNDSLACFDDHWMLCTLLAMSPGKLAAPSGLGPLVVFVTTTGSSIVPLWSNKSLLNWIKLADLSPQSEFLLLFLGKTFFSKYKHYWSHISSKPECLGTGAMAQ